jgi:phage portal protein BeeE
VNLLQRISASPAEQRYTLSEYVHDVSSFYFQGLQYQGVSETYDKRASENPGAGFDGLVEGAYRRNGIVFACQVARLKAFSQVRFMWQQMRAGRSADLFWTPELAVLESPWLNGSTAELLARMVQDVDLTGNSFTRRTGVLADRPGLERLRPDWVLILLGSNRDLLGADLAGYAYFPDGPNGDRDPIYLAPDEVAHWSPLPDPLATYRGMSWLSPIIREIRGDNATTDHKLNFFDHAATPNMVVKMDATVTPEKFERFKGLMEQEHTGFRNAWKNLYLGGGADVTVVGNSFKDMDFRAIQGAGETRIASAAGVPPIVVGLSEGLDAATYSNYAQARRAFADLTIHPLWGSACDALSTVVPAPSRARLWYDASGVPFLKEDQKDAVEIQQSMMTTITGYVRDGFTPESAVAAVTAQDPRLLEHTGRLSVQLKDPNADPEPDPVAALPSQNGSTPALTS